MRFRFAKRAESVVPCKTLPEQPPKTFAFFCFVKADKKIHFLRFCGMRATCFCTSLKQRMPLDVDVTCKKTNGQSAKRKGREEPSFSS